MPQTPRNSDDKHWMRRALDLAASMRGHVWPNPPVGCVIVAGGVMIAQGATQPGGRPHAERVALDAAGHRARGATLYVTLEPCCHWGQTPPCTDAIIAGGIARVVCAMIDPDHRVNGGGIDRLRTAGVAVSLGEGAADAAMIMSGFLHRIATGVPEVVVMPTMPEAVPPDVDALVWSSTAGPRLRFRSGEVVDMLQQHEDALLWIGDMGLTRIAVAQSDPLSTKLAFKPTSAQAV